MKKTNVYILIGGNLGNREKNLRNGSEMIEKNIGKITQKSAMYQTAAWGSQGQPYYLNQALCVSTIWPPFLLMRKLMSIERGMGRIRIQKNESRPLDIDILYYGNLVLNHRELQIPHPRMHLRRFVLIPMLEIAATYIHPVLIKNTNELLKSCGDDLAVTKFHSDL